MAHRLYRRNETLTLFVLSFWFLSAYAFASPQENSSPSSQWETLDGKAVLQRSKSQQTGTLEDQFEFQLEAGEGVSIEFSQNQFGIGRFATYLAHDGQLWVPNWDSDGYCIQCNSFYQLDSMKGGVLDFRGTPLVGILRWSKKDSKFHFQLTLSHDKSKNKTLLPTLFEDSSFGRMPMLVEEKISESLLPENTRIEAWAKLWSEVQNNFVYFDKCPNVDWANAFAEDLPKIRRAITNREYFRILQTRVAMLNDGHTEVYGSGIGQRGSWLPFSVDIQRDGRMVISKTVPLNSIPSQERRSEFAHAKLQVGETITHINDEPISTYLAREVFPLISASTPQWRNLVAQQRWDDGKFHTQARLRIDSLSGISRTVSLTRSHYTMPNSTAKQIRVLDEGLVYFRIDSFSSDLSAKLFENQLPKIRKARGLIIDIRRNGGGNSKFGFQIISHLIEKVIQEPAWKSRKYIPVLRAWKETEQWHTGDPEWIQPSNDPFSGPVALLVGPATYSAAEDFAVALHASRRATLIGEATGGSTGQPIFIQLPGGGSARICCKRDTYPDGREFVGVGVQPDILVKSNLSSDNDEVLNAAIQHLKVNLRDSSERD